MPKYVSGFRLRELVASIKKESVEDEALRIVQRHAVRTALEIMGEPHQTAILLAYFGDMTHTELAEATGVPLGTAKTHALGSLERRVFFWLSPFAHCALSSVVLSGCFFRIHWRILPT